LKASGSPVVSGAGTPELQSFRHLKSVLKKETSVSMHENISTEDLSLVATNDHLRSILKPESSEWDSSSSSSRVNSPEGEIPSRPHSAPAKNSLDLVKILHGVEANARKQRQTSLESENKRYQHLSSNDEKILNLRNYRNEKENQDRRKEHAVFENSNLGFKMDAKISVEDLEMDAKINVEDRVEEDTEVSLGDEGILNQRKLRSKVLMEDLGTKGPQIGLRNQTFSTSKVSESHIIDRKSVVNQKNKLESKKVVDELSSKRKPVVQYSNSKKTHPNAEEEEAAHYERQLHRQIEELQRLSASPATSDGETSSSGGREVRRIIRNEAVARRRHAAFAKQQRQAKSMR
jgi:hypothetical protein